MKESVLESGGLFSSDDESDRPKRKSKFKLADSDFEPQNDDVTGEGKVQRAVQRCPDHQTIYPTADRSAN